MLNPVLHHVPQQGRVKWIGVAATPRSEITVVESVRAEVGSGLAGDHHAKRKPGGKRQVTLIQAEHLPVVASLCRGEVQPAQLRRNLVISGINLLSLKNRQFQIGTAILEGTGDCAPCSRMEENLGDGGFQAMRGHGGITAKVIAAGDIRIGDTVSVLTSAPE